MIISASRRTDIPTYYSDWLFNRLKEEYVLVRNPMNFHQIGRVNLSPDVVDGIVFWTKNPVPMLGRLSELEKYNYYFQFTLTAYDKDVEPNIPNKNSVIIPAFQELSKAVGRDRVVWRYDPILFNDRYTLEYHCKYFNVLASKLGDYTEKCTVSFLDIYHNTARNTQPLQIHVDTEALRLELIERFCETAKKHGLYIDTCSEAIELKQFGVTHSHCIDKERLERLGKCKLSVEKGKNQRAECGCVASIDIGTYNTCDNGCLYCYANYSRNTVVKNTREHNPASPLLFGEVSQHDVIKERAAKSLKEGQLSIF